MRALIMSIKSFERTAASRARGRLRAFIASIEVARRAAMDRAEGPLRRCAAPIARLGRAVGFEPDDTWGKAILAFTVTFVLAMVIGTMVLPRGPRKSRTAPGPALEQVAGPATLAPHVNVLPGLPSAALRLAPARPRSETPARGPEEATRLVSAPSAEQPQTATVAVRASGTARAATARVTEIALWGSQSKPWVSITASGPVRYQLRNVASNWVVIDLSKAELALTSGNPPAGRGMVRLIRAGQFEPGTVRVVLELTDAVPFHVATSPARNAIVVSLAADVGGNSDMAPAPVQRPGRPLEIGSRS